MKNCKICKAKTNNIFNINLSATPICESCASSIFTQQANWYASFVSDVQNKRIDSLDKELKGLLNKHLPISLRVESFNVKLDAKTKRFIAAIVKTLLSEDNKNYFFDIKEEFEKLTGTNIL